jgi:hypothetical protein
MDNTEVKLRGLDIIVQSHDDLAGSVKLYFSFSTGAAVLLVNLAGQTINSSPAYQFWSLFALMIAAVLFAWSAVRAMQATIHFSIVKSRIGRSFKNFGDVELLGDKFLDDSKDERDNLEKELKKMEKTFAAALIFSLLFSSLFASRLLVLCGRRLIVLNAPTNREFLRTVQMASRTASNEVTEFTTHQSQRNFPCSLR